MSSEGAYDTDELRAMAVALDVFDPEDHEEWEGDADAFKASVTNGRERLERRGVASFTRDGGAVLVDPVDACMLRSFLAPDAVIEAWIVDGTVALQREWYLGREVTVVADPVAGEAAQQELATIDTRDVFSDVFVFLDIRGIDVGGDSLRIDADALDDFTGRWASPPNRAQRAPRLLNAAVAWERNPCPQELQFVDAGEGGLWIVTTPERGSDTARDADVGDADVIDLKPATQAEIVERLLMVVTAPPLA